MTEASLVGLLADEEAVVELQNMLFPAEAAAIGRPAQEGPNPGHLPVRPNPEAVASYLRPSAAAGVELVAGMTVHSTISTDTRTTSVASPAYFKCEYGLSK